MKEATYREAYQNEFPAHVAAYTLHLAATNILFLVECTKDLKAQPSG
jgi:hypothetical protein